MKVMRKLILFQFAIFIMLFGLSNCKNPDKQITTADFVGSKTCIECHQKEYDEWYISDHKNAMDTAIAETVLGDFNNASFTRNGYTSKFYIKNNKYFVHTEGPNGVPGDFQILYTFGYRPLQQYLVPFENGRLQCLPIAWDTERKLWYHLADSVYKNQEIKPDDWLYWTNNGQNWNAMCAECHSTNLRKNYNPETRVYNTTWSEINVSCEACHGPSSEHNKWAENKKLPYENYGLVVKTSDITSEELINQCAYCHARRTSFTDFIHPRKEIFDIMSPQLPVEPYYFPDGQILEEDYVYASFTQSKMHKNNVRCTNCHNPHSLKLKFDGNQLCYQCHKEEKYGVYEHHFHKNFNMNGDDLVLENGNKIVPVGEGSLCVNCHMPGRYFMGVDYRRDHSMGIPRPDLSDKLGTPNACTQCHSDKTNKWASDYTKKWYENPYRSHFGETMFLAHNGDTSAVDRLLNIIDDENYSEIVKATATNYLGAFPNQVNLEVNRNLLKSKHALVRREAVRNFIPTGKNDLINTLSPMLSDSTLMVRNEVVSKLSLVKAEELDSVYQFKLKIAIQDYIKAMEYTADFAGSRHNLGNLFTNLGEYNKAIENYEEALRIDKLFYPAKTNMAMLYNRVGNNNMAEKLFIELTQQNPQSGQSFYSLGLLQAEMQKYDEAIENLETAASLIPENNRIKLNLFKLLSFKQNYSEAMEVLDRCIVTEPENAEYLLAKVELLIKLNRLEEAKKIAKKVLEIYPEYPDKNLLLQFIDS